MKVGVPRIHGVSVRCCHVKGLPIACDQLDGKLVGTDVSQGELERGPERDESLGHLLLPSLLGVLVEIKSGSLCLWITFEDKETRFPVS